MLQINKNINQSNLIRKLLLLSTYFVSEVLSDPKFKSELSMSKEKRKQILSLLSNQCKQTKKKKENEIKEEDFRITVHEHKGQEGRHENKIKTNFAKAMVLQVCRF